MAFPSFSALCADIKELNSTLYLTYQKNGGFLEFNRYAEVPSSIAEFVVEEGAGDNLVHIKSCYANKYWCRGGFGNDIVAAADKPEEDRNKYNCTLFEATWFGSKVMFTHVNSGRALCYHKDCSSWNLCLYGSRSLLLKIVDFATLGKLPKLVIFKGDNGKYLRGQWRKARPNPLEIFIPGGLARMGIRYVNSDACEYNEFTAENGDDQSTHYEITQYNGFIRIKSLHFGKFLRASNDEGKIYGDETKLDVVETWFKVNFLGSNKAINLCNLGNNKVCRRKSTFQVDDCLFASESYGVPESKLIVEEPVS